MVHWPSDPGLREDRPSIPPPVDTGNMHCTYKDKYRHLSVFDWTVSVHTERNISALSGQQDRGKKQLDQKYIFLLSSSVMVEGIIIICK